MDMTPSIYYILWTMYKEIILQGGLYGFILTKLLYKNYIDICYYLKNNIGIYYSERILFTILVSISHQIVFYLMTTIFTIFDKYNLFSYYKMPRTEIHKIEAKQLYWKTFLEVSIYMFILNPILAYLIFPLFEYFHGKMSLFDELPSNQSIILSFCNAHIFNDFFFYWTHRSLHAFFYTIHKQHHSHHGPISICAEYAHPFEALLSNVFPTLGGIIFFKTHPLVGMIWVLLRVRQTLETHSGYCFNNNITEFIGLTHANGSAHHDFHHSINQPGNFGEGEYMDYFFGTLKKYVDQGHLKSYVDKKNKAKAS